MRMDYQQIGATTGCHLHFAIKINNVYQDPLAFVEAKK